MRDGWHIKNTMQCLRLVSDCKSPMSEICMCTVFGSLLPSNSKIHLCFIYGCLTTQGSNIHHNQTLEKSTKRTLKLEKSHPYFGEKKIKFLACNYFSNRGQQRIHNLLWNISYLEKPGNNLNLFSSEKHSLELVVENRKLSINLSPFLSSILPISNPNIRDNKMLK